MSIHRQTHAARAADKRRITLCGRPIDDVPLAPHGDWPTCPACVGGVSDNKLHRRALGLADVPAPGMTWDKSAVQP